MALTKAQREEIEDTINALRNEIASMDTEMNQHEDGEVLVDGTGYAWRHSYDDYNGAISRSWAQVDALQKRLIDG